MEIWTVIYILKYEYDEKIKIIYLCALFQYVVKKHRYSINHTEFLSEIISVNFEYAEITYHINFNIHKTSTYIIVCACIINAYCRLERLLIEFVFVERNKVHILTFSKP